MERSRLRALRLSNSSRNSARSKSGKLHNKSRARKLFREPLSFISRGLIPWMARLVSLVETIFMENFIVITFVITIQTILCLIKIFRLIVLEIERIIIIILLARTTVPRNFYRHRFLPIEWEAKISQMKLC